MSSPASDTDYRTNPRALKWWRLKNHYSQRDVEEKTGVSYTTISRLENGHRTRALGSAHSRSSRKPTAVR